MKNRWTNKQKVKERRKDKNGKTVKAKKNEKKGKRKTEEKNLVTVPDCSILTKTQSTSTRI